MISGVSLFAFLLLLTVASYKHFDDDLTHPAVLYNFCFALAVGDGLLNFQKWDFSLSGETLFVVGFGSALFTFVCVATDGLFNRKRRVVRWGAAEESSRLFRANDVAIYVPLAVLVLALVLVVATYFFLARYAMDLSASNSAGGDLASGLALNNGFNKFNEGRNLSVPKPVAWASRICIILGFAWNYIAAKNLVSIGRKTSPLLLIVMVLTWGLPLMGGARDGVLKLAISFVVLFLMFKRLQDGPIRLTPRRVLFACCVLALAAFGFAVLSEVLGRGSGSVEAAFNYMSVYLGAPVKNLDMYLTGTLPRPITTTSHLWGEQTFAVFYNRLFDLSDSERIMNWLAWQPFQYHGANGLGNVYTTYYVYIFDWGVPGAFVATAITALASQLVYMAAMSYRSAAIGLMKLSMVVYSVVAYGLVFCFFLNFLAKAIVSVDFAYQVIGWVAFSMVLEAANRGRGEAKTESTHGRDSNFVDRSGRLFGPCAPKLPHNGLHVRDDGRFGG